MSRRNEHTAGPFGTRPFQTEGSRRWFTGVIIAHSPETQNYTVRTSTHAALRGVPRLVRDPGEVGLLPLNTTVAIHDELGYWVIDSVIKQAPSNAVELNPTQVTEVRGVGGEDPVYQQGAQPTDHRAPNDPRDLLAGDWVRRSPDGNLMGVLAGGVNVMKSGAFAQVRTHKHGNLVEIISEAYRHLTAMGDLTVSSEGGKTSLVWRAGADQATENGVNTGNWTIRLDVGASGDLFNLEITTPQGQTLSRIHMSAEGKISIAGTAGVDITSGGSGVKREDVAGDVAAVTRGAHSHEVRQTYELDVGGARTTSVGASDSVTVGNDHNVTVQKDHNEYVGGVVRSTIQGGLPPSGGPAVQWEIVNGGVETVLANPTKGGLPGGAGQSWVSYAGDFSFALNNPTSSFEVLSTAPGSVKLGATGTAVPNPATGRHEFVAVAPFASMKFEPFAAMMSTLLTHIDTHVHGTAVGPSTPPIVPASPLVQPLVAPIQSLRVRVGA